MVAVVFVFAGSKDLGYVICCVFFGRREMVCRVEKEERRFNWEVNSLGEKSDGRQEGAQAGAYVSDASEDLGWRDPAGQ